MNKKVVILLIFIGTTAFLSAQNLQNNPDYRKSVQLKEESQKAYNEGDFKESTRLAKESLLYAQKSDEWIDMMLKKYRANSMIHRLKNKIYTASRKNGDKNFPEEMNQARTLHEQAKELYEDEDFVKSYELAKEAYDLLDVVVYIQDKDDKSPYVGATKKLPAAYQVRNIPNQEDCLWKIAGYDFIYGDPLKWELIYKANKGVIPQESNPDLIHPNLILQIPSLDGEKREGTWVNGNIK